MDAGRMGPTVGGQLLMDEPAMLTDAEVARILKAHPDTQIVGRAEDFEWISCLLAEIPDGEWGTPLPKPEPGGVYVATTATDQAGNTFRYWFWQADAARWEQDASARGELR